MDFDTRDETGCSAGKEIMWKFVDIGLGII